jgi:hypothetical protein
MVQSEARQIRFRFAHFFFSPASRVGSAELGSSVGEVCSGSFSSDAAFLRNAKPTNPTTTKAAPATIIQCGYCIAEPYRPQPSKRVRQPTQIKIADGQRVKEANSAGPIGLRSASFEKAISASRGPLPKINSTKPNQNIPVSCIGLSYPRWSGRIRRVRYCAAQPSGGSRSNACGGYRCPSGVVIEMS